MILDLAVVNGVVHDGLGSPARPADVGVHHGIIVHVTEPGGLAEAAQCIDASGCIVTPGFIDPHTHMDAQIWWSPEGAPSVLHGVTSVVIGSCGFGVAPVGPGGEEYTLRSLEAVEEIPYEVTRTGVPMSWRTWPEYFDQVGGLRLGVNLAGFLPHSALRSGALAEPATTADLQAPQIAGLRDAVRRALAAGAVGLSTSRGGNHTDALGLPVPSRLALDSEMVELISECAGRVWQINIQSKGDRTDEGIARAVHELETYAAWARATGTRVTWTPLVVTPGDHTAWRRLLDCSIEHADVLVPQISAQAIHSAISFDGPSFASMIDGWAVAFAGYGSLTMEQRRDRLADPAFRAILRDVPENPFRVTAPCYSRWRLAVSTTARDQRGETLAAIAASRGVHPVDAMLDIALADELATVVEAPLSNLDDDCVRELVTDPHTLIGLGDAGAHIKSITNYTYPTFVLGELGHRRGWLTVEQAVHRLSRQPAEFFGFEDRGILREGAHADLCVIDLDRLAVLPAELRDDLPAGGRRLHCGARGYRAVIVNGAVTVSNDELTGARAGQLLRREG